MLVLVDLFCSYLRSFLLCDKVSFDTMLTAGSAHARPRSTHDTARGASTGRGGAGGAGGAAGGAGAGAEAGAGAGGGAHPVQARRDIWGKGQRQVQDTGVGVGVRTRGYDVDLTSKADENESKDVKEFAVSAHEHADKNVIRQKRPIHMEKEAHRHVPVQGAGGGGGRREVCVVSEQT